MQSTGVPSHRSRGLAASGRKAPGFTLVELLIVIFIIMVLVSILVPVANRVRQAGVNASAQSFMTQLSRAIEAYEADFRAYPGPLTNNEVWNVVIPVGTIVVDPTAIAEYENQLTFCQKITMSENLVLGLMGGLKRAAVTPFGLQYDPRLVGGGAYSLNASGPTKRFKHYLEAVNLSWRTDPGIDPNSPADDKKTGRFKDDGDTADDSIIPEIVDNYSDPLPILYLRAKRGAQARPGAINEINNSIVTYDPVDHTNRVGQYDLHQIMAYTSTKIGIGRKVITPVGWINPVVHGLMAGNADKVQPFASMSETPPQPLLKYMYPFNAYPYFRNQALSSPKEADPEMMNLGSPRNDIPHQKDGFILIGAGADRIYGTKDDLTNFGTVGQ